MRPTLDFSPLVSTKIFSNLAPANIEYSVRNENISFPFQIPAFDRLLEERIVADNLIEFVTDARSAMRAMMVQCELQKAEKKRQENKNPVAD